MCKERRDVYLKEEKVKEIKQNAESLKNANGDTAVKIAAEINKNDNNNR